MREPCDMIVQEIPSVLAIIQHILLFHPRLLKQAIRFLAILLYVILFFTCKPYQQSPSVLAIIQHILLCHPHLLYKAIRFCCNIRVAQWEAKAGYSTNFHIFHYSSLFHPLFLLHPAWELNII